MRNHYDDERPVLIPVAKVCERFGGVSQMWVNRRLKDDPLFPQPVYISKRRFFRVDELDAYERALPRGRTYEEAVK